MHFSHPYDHHERSSVPVRPVPHENLFLEPAAEVKVRARRTPLLPTSG
jgi:hypothetical protein